MPRTANPDPHIIIKLPISRKLLARFENHLTPTGFTKPPYGARQRILAKLIREYCETKENKTGA